MAPGLNERQTGTVPKNKSRSCGSQSHRLTSEPFIQLPYLEWENMSEIGNKNHSKKKSSTSRSEAEADSLKHELGTSRPSTVTSQNGNGESCSCDSFPGKTSVPDRKQVANKLSQIQSYVQQTATLMNALKTSDSPNSKVQYEKLSVVLEELKDSESKLRELLNKMDNTEFRIDSLLVDMAELKGSNIQEADEEELVGRSRESKKKIEVLQKKKQELLKLQEKAKKQLQEAQAEQSRLVTRTSSLNQELSAHKVVDLNVQQLSQRLKAVQEIFSTRNQITENLNVNQRGNKVTPTHVEEDTETSDTETDFQLVADKMEELDAMKAQLGQIQKLMASISAMQNPDLLSNTSQSLASNKEQENHNSLNSSFNEIEQNANDGNNFMKLEQAKSKLNYLTQLLEVVQSAQNTNGLSPSCLQLVSNLVNEETNSCTESPSPASSVKSPQRNCEDISVKTMQVMTKELEDTTAAMKEQRDKLLAARQELQGIAKRLPLNKSEAESISPDYDSESEPPCLKLPTLDSNTRDSLNGLTEVEQSFNCNEGSPQVTRPVQSKNRQCGFWNSFPGCNFISQERRNKNESFSRGSNQSFRGISHPLGRDQSQWSSSPSISCYNDRQCALTESQQQLEMSGNLCEMILSEYLQRGICPNDISLQEMFNQHQLLTRVVAQCSQLLWLQQKQIIELRNAVMLQCRPNLGPQLQSVSSNQSQLNVLPMGNPSYLVGPSLSNIRHIPPVSLQQQQNFLHAFHPNVKLNAGDMQNVSTTSQQDFPDHYLQHGNQSLNFPDGFGCDMRTGDFSRFNSSSSNSNHNFQQNLNSGFSNRGPNGINSVAPEDSGALNNQVPPGNRANNYWDNFRSYSRQNLLSHTKSNEDSELSRRSLSINSQDRPPREGVSSLSQNNQSTAGLSQQPFFGYGNCESTNDQHLLPPNQNIRSTHHSQIVRSSSADSQSQRNSGKNESRHQDHETRNFNSSAKNEGGGGGGGGSGGGGGGGGAAGAGAGRTRNSDSMDIRSVRNDVSQGLRSTDNINSTRNLIQMVRDMDNEEQSLGTNKKRLERNRCRNEGLGNLNNRGYQNTSLWDSIYAEVSNFIRANESRPHFLLQLFRDLQHVTTDNLRQRTLVTIQETVTANNLTERTSNIGGGNINIRENRNNIRESRSNLNRNLVEDPNRIGELFYHLRENQNTIRQNIGMSSYVFGGNLENPNISNIRDLGNSRNNLENEGLRDLRTYFEANLCNFGHNSTLENPNLSNIRENLTRRAPGMSDLENVHPKNVYLSIYDNAVEPRRRNQESAPDFGSPYRNFELGDDYLGNEISGNCENVRATNNHFEVENNFEGAVGGRAHFPEESRSIPSRFPVLDAGDNFGRSRQYLGNGNDSGIDINFNNDERKTDFAEGDANVNLVSVKTKKNGSSEVESASALILRSDWERNGGRQETSFESSLNVSRKEVTSPFIPIYENSFFHCRTFQQSDNGDLVEADQSRNEETSGAESDSGFMNAQIVDSGIPFTPDRNLQSLENNFSSQNIPEAERNFMDIKKCENACNIGGSCAVEPEGSSSSSNRQEGNMPRLNDDGDGHRKNEVSENFYYHMNASSSSENAVPKSNVKYRKRSEETAEREGSAEYKKSSCESSGSKFRESSFAQGKYNGSVGDDVDNRKTDSDSVGSAADGRQQNDSNALCYLAFQRALDKSLEAEKGNTSPEAESDWECGSGLDQVPTKLNRSGSSKKSEDSGDSIP